ncbi:MAG: hypothetical protein MMC33_006715 [Icmadophila ericetorum]|nr:hypothetical protein [Icmadophila ericetorum]
MPSLPSFLRSSKGSYNLVVDSKEPYNEEYSIKALLAEERSSVSGSSSSEQLPPYIRRPEEKKSYHGLFLGINIALFIFSSFLSILSGWPMLFPADKFNNTLLRGVSEHSPIFDQVHIPLTTIRRNGSFVNPDPLPIWRQPPSEEVDKAWARLSDISPVPLSSADVIKLGADPSKTARFPEVFGLGPDAHIGRIDIFHQVHCLDSLRRNIYFDHYYGDKFQGRKPDANHYIHVNHCIDVLLQNLLCTAPLNPILHYWVEGLEEPFPNFDDNHKCHDIDVILKWHEEKSIDLTTFRKKSRRPEGVYTKKLSQTYLNMLAHTDAIEHFKQNQASKEAKEAGYDGE